MADEYPFIPYSFSEPVPPTPDFSTPATPTSEEKPSFSESPPAFSDDNDEDETAQKTALGIVAGVLVLLLLVGFGIWYLLRDKSDGEIPPVPPIILAAVGGTVVTPEGAAIIIPAGALSQDTRVEIAKVNDGEVTDLFELKPLGQKFLKPVTVEIPYKKSGPIILEYWRKEGEKKRALKYTMDKEGKKLRTLLEKF